MKRLRHGDGVVKKGAGYGGWSRRSISDLPEELLENILWRIKKAPQAAACASVCSRWLKIVRRSPAIEFDFRSTSECNAVRIPRAEAILGGMLLHRGHNLKSLSISYHNGLFEKQVPSDERLAKWFLRLVHCLHTLRLDIPGFSFAKTLSQLPWLQRLFVTSGALRKMPRCVMTDSLTLCRLDSVVFYRPLNDLLSACPRLETLILNCCRVSCCTGIELCSDSLQLLFIVNSHWAFIFLDLPNLQVLGCNSVDPEKMPCISASARTASPFTFLVTPVRLERIKVRGVFLIGEEWRLLPTRQPAIALDDLFQKFSPRLKEAMLEWLATFKRDYGIFGSQMKIVLNETDQTWGLAAASAFSYLLCKE